MNHAFTPPVTAEGHPDICIAIAREEAEALRAWADMPSVVTLLAADVATGALLLENVEPRAGVSRRTPLGSWCGGLFRGAVGRHRDGSPGERNG